MGIEIIVSPSLHELEKEMPVYIWEHIKALQDSGRSVIPFLTKTIDEGGECAELFKRYLQELNDFNNANGHAITTHRRFSMMDVRKYDLVIIDEDIIMSTIITNKVTVDISDLKKRWKWLKKYKANSLLAIKVRKILKHIADSNGETSYFSAKKIPFVKAYDAIPMGVDIASLCSATEFCYRMEPDSENGQSAHYLSFMNPVEFRKDTKYIMLSATANEGICEHYFGANNVMFYDCLKGRNEGTINLIYNRSMSRADINKDSDIIGRIQKWSGFEHGISFIKFRDVLEKHYQDCMTYGSCAGRDHFKGKNIDVIGTPHQPDWIYKLFARSLKLEFDPDERIKNRKVEHNGFRFWFATFENEYLRDIQFYIIESELEQAVGRARSLRCKCTVNLISNFPLSQVELMEADYDNHAGANGTVHSER